MRAAEAWACLLHVPKDNNSLLLMRVGHVMALPDSIRTTAYSISDIDHQIYLKWLPQVESALRVLNFETGWSEFINRFDGAVMYGLEICSDLLSRQRPEKTIEQESIESLRQQVDELLSATLNTALPEDIKSFIVTHASQIKIALEEYSLLGFGPLEHHVHTVVGALSFHPGLYERSKETEAGAGFWRFMGNVAVIVTVAAGAHQIGKDFFYLLSSPDTLLKSDVKYDNNRTSVAKDIQMKREEIPALENKAIGK